MKVGKDGSFPRITSTTKGIEHCVKIVEVPEDEKEESGLVYKLVWICEDEDENESSDSVEEPWSDEEDSSTVQLSVENTEKSKDSHSNPRDEVVINEPLNWSPDKQFVRESTNERYDHRIPNQDNFHSAERNVNPSYNSMANTSNRQESNYSYDSINRNSFGAPRRNYNQPINNSSDISPWVTPPMAFSAPVFQYTHNQYGMPNQHVHPVEHIGHTFPNPNIGGLLGNSPFNHSTTNFPQNSRNDDFRYGNYWNNDEYHHSDNYQGSGHGQTHFRSRRPWNKNRKSHNYWNRNVTNQDRNHPLQRRNQDRNSSLPARRQNANSSRMRGRNTNSSRMRGQSTNSSSRMKSQNLQNEPRK